MTSFIQKAAMLAAFSVAASGAIAQSMSDVPFTCTDGRLITVDFSGDTAKVTMTMSLDAKPSGSGFRYEGAAGELSGKGDEIMWKDSDNVTCTAVPGGADLVGGTWELLQVMPDGPSGEVILADDPARHSLSFLADGALALKADCNRGRGTWSAVPDGQGSGTLTLGPAAVTRMACAADPFPQLAADLDKAVAYGLEDGNLRLELEGGAVYLFGAAMR